MTWIVAFRTDDEYHWWLARADNLLPFISPWPGDACEWHDPHAVHNACVAAQRDLTPRWWRGQWVGLPSSPFAQVVAA